MNFDEWQRVEETAIGDKCLQKLDELETILLATKDACIRDPGNVSKQLTGSCTKTEQVFDDMKKMEKRFNSSMNKFGKALDRKFNFNLEDISLHSSFEDKKNELNTALALHFFRQGETEIAHSFCKEAGIEEPPNMVQAFTLLNTILQGIRQHDLQFAIDWALQCRGYLERKGSNLEFLLHRHQLLNEYFQTQDVLAAIHYCRTYLTDFQDKHLKEMQKLIGALFFSSRSASVVSSKMNGSHKGRSEQHEINQLANDIPEDYRKVLRLDWKHLELIFVREFCAALGMSLDSPVDIVVNAGSIALPVLLKVSNIMKQKHTEWTSQNELPVEIHLPTNYHFHSVFTCPVSKEQATEENPPMMMSCGHVIAQESLRQLSRNGSQHFKCPYCPNENDAESSTRVYF
ncbi:GID complex ubiquitin-protein ligase E3 subunit Gid2/Rmd5 [Schizosaccharomyces osmophilus]|uniref:GID complex catalytic subunit 2 n=1 Tax=Schizosaccharomyces osmophilus TaxID=2545709 RepID=A0AAE9WB01_9SCHI|nr:GID complex ubiquitin-protein ligase E3 subunit Gid2/Rmd5 [Schizosaccharomyces osmophilus]WBW72580.1 GID complex ubiquitin-protein ligase E3 subunit Gid2/Rmd5 [Schizosaccharomyces osmophilus]